MKCVGLDFETRSKTDITAGIYNYASCPTTDILCLSIICEETDDEWLWYPHDGPLPANAVKRLNAADFVKAQNAEFDKAIWEFIAVPDYNFPKIAEERWYCTAAECRINALPSALDKAARALKIKRQKDTRGKQLIKLLSIPDKNTGEFNEDPAALKEMGEYCLQDSRVMMDITRSIRSMSAQEHADWLITVHLNDAGARIDREMAELAVNYAEDEKQAIAEKLTALTGGAVTKHTQSARIKAWVLEETNHDSEIVKQMTVYKEGVTKLSLDKAIRANLIELSDTSALHLPEHVLEVIELTDQGNKSSVSKFQKMLTMAHPEDDRVRGAFVFAGAGQTQRFASRGLQLHNMRRDCWSATEALGIKADMQEDYELDNVMDTLSKLLRPTIMPDDGKVFVVGDWSAIEGRILPWITGDPRAEEVLDIFRSDEDIYLHTAASMRIDDRQIGKVATLALGYQGAVGAFQSMAKNYGLKLPESQVKHIVKKWREANRWAVDFWANCERAAIMAMRKPNEYIPIGRCHFVYIEGLIDGTLCGILPDGTIIQYPRAKLEYVETQYGGKHQVSYMKASLTPKADAKEWPRHTLYGGIIAENFTQATAGCILREPLRRLENVVLHVHDEIVLEVDTAIAEDSMTMLQSVMEEVPSWAEGLPLKAEPEIMDRYGK